MFSKLYLRRVSTTYAFGHGINQIGNEINYGMSGETKFENVVTLIKSGGKAIREVSDEYRKDINAIKERKVISLM